MSVRAGEKCPAIIIIKIETRKSGRASEYCKFSSRAKFMVTEYERTTKSEVVVVCVNAIAMGGGAALHFDRVLSGPIAAREGGFETH